MDGDEQSRERLFETAYSHMQDIAIGMLRFDRQRYVLQPSDLVNECVVRMFGLREIDWRDRAHFAAMAALTMRRILVDESRRQNASKRKGMEVTLVTGDFGSTNDAFNVSDVDVALSKLADISAILAHVVELKYFGGLTNKEVGVVIEASEATVKRHWRSARAWLYSELKE